MAFHLVGRTRMVLSLVANDHITHGAFPLFGFHAGLTRECVVIGAGPRLEVWDAQTWDTYLADREGAFADLSEEVLPGLI